MPENVDYDPVDVVREIRLRISRQFDDDLDRYVKHLQELEKTLPNPVYHRPPADGVRREPRD
jgi:hypothetical protein